MGFPEIETSSPLEASLVESYKIKVRRGNKFRKVAARAIAGSVDGHPSIQLGEIEVGFISGGAALDLRDESIVEVKPANVAIHPEGERLRVYDLPE